jgi:quinol monooxygenase YgiN
MYRLSLKIESPPGKQKEVFNILKLLIAPVSVSPGCLQCRLYEDTLEDGIFLIVEDWQTREDLVRQLDTENFKKLMMVIEMSAAPPEIRCEQIHNKSGIASIEALMR